MSTFQKGYLTLAVAGLRSTKSRSLLTMLGIIIGVMAVIIVVGISQGVKVQIGLQNERYGKDVIVIKPRSFGGTIFSGSSIPNGANTMLTPKDMETVSRVKGVQKTTMISAVSGSAAGDKVVDSPLVIATNTNFPDIISQPVQYGGFFDDNTSLPTVVLGPHVAQRLFTDNVPLGQTVTFRKQQFLVAGVFKEFAASPFSLEANFNDAIFMPYDVAQGLLGSAPSIYELLVKTTPGAQTNDVAKHIQQTLIAAHGGANDITVGLNGQEISGSNDTLRLLTLMTVGVAMVAFIVGGVGIMNVMLVSVTERIHEIGLRKAVGATRRQILSQFVTEAFVLSTTGALVGLVLALSAIGVIRLYTTLEPVIVWQVLVIAPLAAIVTGVVFGSFPALKAAGKDPIEALRHE